MCGLGDVVVDADGVHGGIHGEIHDGANDGDHDDDRRHMKVA